MSGPAGQTEDMVDGAWREQRRSRRVVARMDRAAARAARREARREHHRLTGRRRLRALGLVGALGLAGGAVVVGTGLLQEIVGPRAYVEVDGRPVRVPEPEPSDGRLAPAVPVTTAGTYAFLHTSEDGSPVGYDPCRPVRYVVRPDGMPDGGQQLVEEAAAIIGEATGLVLEYVGTTDEPPAVERTLIQPERYGHVWAPVLVAWSDGRATPELAGDVAGVGGSAVVPGADGTGSWLAAGRIVLDVEDIGQMMERRDGWAQARALVVHELAHVVGLDHVDDPTELMYPVSATRTDLGSGDRAGLALVGQVACEG